jgi:hypothetical protein
MAVPECPGCRAAHARIADLAGAHREALDAVAAAAVKHVDETSGKERGHKRWLWVAATGTLAGGRSRDRKLARHCARVPEVSPALWAVLVCAGVEPTNNHAERVLRRAVLWRRRSFGCHSADGCRFVERLLTVVQSLRLQKRSVLALLHDTLCAHRTGTQMPRLVVAG